MESLSGDEINIIALMLPLKEFINFSMTSKEYKIMLDGKKIWRNKYSRIQNKNDFQYCYLKVKILYYQFLKMYKLNKSNIDRIKRMVDLNLIFIGNELLKNMFNTTYLFFKNYHRFNSFENKIETLHLYIYLFEYAIYISNFEPELLYSIMVSCNDNIEYEMNLNLLQGLATQAYELSYYSNMLK